VDRYGNVQTTMDGVDAAANAIVQLLEQKGIDIS
jgi:hypothetical protein